VDSFHTLTSCMGRYKACLLYTNVLAEIAIIISFAIVTSLNPECTQQFDLVEAYRLAAIFLSLFAQFYFAYHSIVKSRITQIIAFLFISVITALSFYAKVWMVWSSCSRTPGFEALLFVYCLLIFLNLFCYFVIADVVYKDAQWNMARISLVEEDQKILKAQEGFVGMLKVNLVLQLLIFLGYFMLTDYEEVRENNSYWYATDAIVLFFFLIATRIGYVSAKSKTKVKNIHYYLVYIFATQIYEIAKLWPLFDVESDPSPQMQNDKTAIIISQMMICAVGLAVQFYTTILARRFYREVHNLPEKIDIDDLRSDTVCSP